MVIGNEPKFPNNPKSFCMVTVTVTSSFNCRFPVLDHCTVGWIPVLSSKTLCLFEVSLPTLPLISASLASSSAKLSTCILVIKMGNNLTPSAITNMTHSTMTATSMYPSPLLSRTIFLSVSFIPPARTRFP